MGIKGLWELVAPVAEHRDLTALALDGMRPSSGPTRLYRVGVDASLWFWQIQASFLTKGTRRGKNPELRTLLFRLANLYTKPLAVVFVGDGPARPDIKRNTNVGKKAHWLTVDMKDLVSAFGFEYLEAPAEAEAELASMCQAGLIDAVMTDDGDTLMFGAETVIRKPWSSSSRKEDGDVVTIYRASAIQENPAVQMTRNSMVLLAVLAGGDYDDGLHNCGARIAYGLARYGLGDALVACVTNSVDDESLRVALSTWRQELLRLLRADPDGYIGKRCASLAATVPEAFPDPAVIRAYVRPLTTSPDNIALDDEFGRAMKFDLARLQHLCKNHFSWDEAELRKRMRALVWPGTVLRLFAEARFNVPFSEHEIPIVVSRYIWTLLCRPY
ncbi:PIN domain-like protein [Cerioporus squamosus]|nr:PIN domain-like protein [Cerioporus squamosus]